MRSVIDTSVLIDLFHGDVLADFFRIPGDIITTDIVVKEIELPPAQLVLGLGLTQRSLPGESILEIQDIRSKHNNLSIADISALVLAKKEKTILLTGDSDLRKTASNDHGLDVHGTLWILDTLLESGIIGYSKATLALEKMIANGSWFPRDEVTRRFEAWKRDTG